MGRTSETSPCITCVLHSIYVHNFSTFLHILARYMGHHHSSLARQGTLARAANSSAMTLLETRNPSGSVSLMRCPPSSHCTRSGPKDALLASRHAATTLAA